jgi:hypothetical protein
MRREPCVRAYDRHALDLAALALILVLTRDLGFRRTPVRYATSRK